MTPELLTKAADGVKELRDNLEQAEKVLRMAALIPDQLQEQAAIVIRITAAADKAMREAAEKEPTMQAITKAKG